MSPSTIPHSTRCGKKDSSIPGTHYIVTFRSRQNKKLDHCTNWIHRTIDFHLFLLMWVIRSLVYTCPFPFFKNYSVYSVRSLFEAAPPCFLAFELLPNSISPYTHLAWCSLITSIPSVLIYLMLFKFKVLIFYCIFFYIF